MAGKLREYPYLDRLTIQSLVVLCLGFLGVNLEELC